MIGATLAQRNDVIDFHSMMEIVARCTDTGGPDISRVGPCHRTDVYPSRTSRMGRRIVNGFMFLWIFLPPFAAHYQKLFFVFMSVFSHLFAISVGVFQTPFSAIFRSLFLAIWFLTSLSLLVSKMLRVLFALLAYLGSDLIAFLGAILRVVVAQLLLILHAPSRLVLAVAGLVGCRPQLRAQARFDLPFFGFIHRPTMPHFGAANNYAT